MLVYLCAGLNETEVNDSAPCTGGVGESVAECRGGEVIAGWAVGGEVSNTRPNIDKFHESFTIETGGQMCHVMRILTSQQSAW